MNTITSGTAATAPVRTSPLGLRPALLLDAVVTVANGLAYVVGSVLLTSLLGPSAPVLVAIGLFLVVYAVGVTVVGNRRPIPRRGAVAVVEVNALWAAASLAVLAGGWLELTSVGSVWLVMQAGVVGGFAVLQALALRAGR